MVSDIPYYEKFVSSKLRAFLAKYAKPVKGVEGLSVVGETPQELREFESKEALQFICDLYLRIREQLRDILQQRLVDRQFIQQTTTTLVAQNQSQQIPYLDARYQTIIGICDDQQRLVVGPYNEGEYYQKVRNGNWQVATIPEHMQGFHLTLFGPADTEKMSINAMNAWHRKSDDEPHIVTKLVEGSDIIPRWGADDEDSKTPMRLPFLQAINNLRRCFDKSIHFIDAGGREYLLQQNRLSHPIKRFPGLALPTGNHLYQGNPLPLHLYDFALHLFHHWQQPQALCFYVPKLETEEEARYLKNMIETAEQMIAAKYPQYQVGTVRVLVVLENPRAIFRTEEIMYELRPYFAGASLGWHDYLASAASLFQNDPNYRIPVKADPDIVINHIKESHDFLRRVIGKRGGIKIGGMYGILPEADNSASYQVSMIGFIRDVITQLKRGLDGFWIAHPDFIRPGIALVEAWRELQKDNSSAIEELIRSLVEDPQQQQQVLAFIHSDDIAGLNPQDPLYPRALLAADIEESTVIANNHPDEIRYNVFQALQYLADWLAGNGCVALPAQIKETFVRIMDDLATTERSRREVWAEVHHGRFSRERLREIFTEELQFIRDNRATETRKVQVQWDAHTQKWYPIAAKVLYKLMTEDNPVEFATEYLLAFTFEPIRKAADPWRKVAQLDPEKFFTSSELFV